MASVAPKVRARDDVALVRVAVLIPCYNEEASIAGVVEGFRRALPRADIYVYDNNSADGTRAAAAAAGAVVRQASLQGKGNVVRRMFADIDADAYVLVDGDGTYDPTAAPAMLARLFSDGLDMIAGARVSSDAGAFRRGHQFGNRMLTALVRQVFGRQFNDMLTGYRVISRRFVKSFPSHSRGFEVETELTVYTLQMRLPAAEMETPYAARPAGSESKLNTVRDGLRILRMIGLLVREEKPLQFFGAIAGMAAVLAVAMGVPVILDFLRLGAVPRFPTLIVAVGLAVVSMLSLTCGLILDAVARGRLEQRRFAYLSVPRIEFFGSVRSFERPE